MKLKDLREHAKLAVMNMRHIPSLLFLSLATSAAVFCVPMQSMAQNGVFGQYNPSQAEEKKEEPSVPVPRVFSSKIVSSVEEAQKLDLAYQNLKIGLWNYADVGFSYQASLMSLMQPEKFATTRHKDEFIRPMDKALDSLNESYKKMNLQIDDAQANFVVLEDQFTSQELDVLKPLWAEKIKEFKAQKDKYFKSQHQFLLLYKKLAAFILKNNGAYYYSSDGQTVKFYDIGDYTFFASTIDTLIAIGRKQKEFLRTVLPNADLITQNNK